MKFYNLESLLAFGKYEGKTVRQIIGLQPSYIDWCARNLDHFYISKGVIKEIKKIEPNFTLTDEGLQKLDEKYSKWRMNKNPFKIIMDLMIIWIKKLLTTKKISLIMMMV